MDPMTMALIGSAVIGMMKSNSQRKAYNSQVDVESTKAQWSPFTGDRGQSMRRPDAMDPMMQSLVTGAMIGQKMGSGDAAAAPVPQEGQAGFVGPPSNMAGSALAQPAQSNFVGPPAPMPGAMPQQTSYRPTNASYFARSV